MSTKRTVAAAVLLLVEAGLAVLGVTVHYGLTAEYGTVGDSALKAWLWSFSGGIGGLALGLVAAPAVAAAVLSARRWMRVAALVIPALMLLGMLAVTPLALQTKLEVQYDATPQCRSSEHVGRGPGVRAERASQEAFESIEHVGHFGGGGASGVGGCDRSFVLLEDVDVIEHYRSALPAAGWRIVDERDGHLRAVRDDMAFEVVACDGGGVVWAGAVDEPGRLGVTRQCRTTS